MKYFSALKKNEILAFATTQMDLEDVMFISENIYIYLYIRQIDRQIDMFKVRESQMMYVVTYMHDLKNQISEYHKNVIDSQVQRTNQWLPVKRGYKGGPRKGQGIQEYKLLCLST